MPFDPAVAAGYSWFKAALFALLGCNAAVYLLSGTVSEALDTMAWLVLLLLFELETGLGARFSEGRGATAVRGIRMAAAAAVIGAAAGYIRERQWLDAVNAVLWISVAAVLEFEVRWPQWAAGQRRRFAAATSVLYAGLGAVALAWMWRGEWFDAYDALLWLAALVVIEMNILQGMRREAGVGRARPG